MIIVGEKINTSRKAVSEAVETKDHKYIQKIAIEQFQAGAAYVDVNAGTFLDREVELLPWLVETVQAEVDCPLCLDSPNPKALERALKVHRGEAMINSISLEKNRFDALLPIMLNQPCHVVALCMAETAMPTSTQDRVLAAEKLVERLTGNGFPLENIYVDPLIQPVSVDVLMGSASLEAIGQIMRQFPGINTICGLSNISYGLPSRRMINRYFLSLAMSKGLNAVIMDPTDSALMSAMVTIRMLLGQDEYCSNFIDAYERGLFRQDT